MKIEEVNCFALRGDGTLLIKTEPDELGDKYQYCFYITDTDGGVFKSPYVKESFIMYKAEKLGVYTIKAFMKNTETDEKVNEVSEYKLTAKKAWLLAPAKEQPQKNASVSLEFLEGMENPAIIATVKGDITDDMEYAWYIYKEGEPDTEYRSPYLPDRTFLYYPKKKGTYSVKVFINGSKGKFSVKSNTVEVS
ncbi:MAG: hypothetical protein IKD89_07990 [Clostridia bacterium]|nr:hypothetical protein [Clostridia bacterium]